MHETPPYAVGPLPSRRELLSRASIGFGTLALAGLCAGRSTPAQAADARSAREPHFGPRARNVIFLFMEGGVSQVDSLDYKPHLEKYHGQSPHNTIGKIEKTQFENIGVVMRSPWKFRRRGQSGIWISDLFPHLASVADELCVIRSMTSKFPEHTSANYLLHNGLGLQGRPSLGAWVSYGLSTECRDLPGYVVLNGGQIPSGGLDNFSNGFLPAVYQGSLLNAAGTPLANIYPQERNTTSQRLKRDLARQLNQSSLEQTGKIDALESAIANFELAARMQVSIPELMDLSTESEHTRRMYGIDSDYHHTQTYARQCMIARRLVERGVRFVELTIPMVDGYSRWDAHGNIVSNHGNNARAVDQPIAALLRDLKQRGLLDQTLVIWSGEFGRTPFAQGSDGRDHNEYAFSLWLAGGGVKPGIVYGETDEWGYKAVQDRLDIHDLHATILHLMGIDHETLTYRFSGRDIRLTDVYGRIIKPILS